MPEIVCPECNHTVMCPENYLGKNWRCPDCRTRIVARLEGKSALGWLHEGPHAPPPSTPAASEAETAPQSPRAHASRSQRVIEWLIAALIGALLASWWWARSG